MIDDEKAAGLCARHLEAAQDKDEHEAALVVARTQLLQTLRAKRRLRRHHVQSKKAALEVRADMDRLTADAIEKALAELINGE